MGESAVRSYLNSIKGWAQKQILILARSVAVFLSPTCKYTEHVIYIGTSGFSYDDWKGHFYPEKMDKKDMLAYYAGQLPGVEVNSTYYAIPAASTFESMCRRTPAEFRFVVKAHKDMTHIGEPSVEAFRGFREAIRPVAEVGKLGCVLAQYPWSFKNNSENQGHLRRLKEYLPDIPTIVEFRNADWVTDETFALLRELDLGFCSVDEPHLKGLMPQVAAATSSVAYVRFHGRNFKDWWQHEQAWQRYNYLYTEEELAEWVPRVRNLEEKSSDVYLFFNNHYKGKSAQNARMFAKMLGIALPEIAPPPHDGTLGL